MSFLTGGCTELLYASTVAGAAVAASSETQINDTATMGVQARLEPDFWLPNNTQISKAIHVTARGVVTTSTSAPQLNFKIRAGTAGITGPILLQTTAATNGITASSTNAPWLLEGDIIVSTMGAAGGNTTVQGSGHVICIFGNTALPWIMTGTATTLDTSITNFLSLTALFSLTANSITLQQLLVYGLN
jgi:hypothetical protein